MSELIPPMICPQCKRKMKLDEYLGKFHWKCKKCQLIYWDEYEEWSDYDGTPLIKIEYKEERSP